LVGPVLPPEGGSYSETVASGFSRKAYEVAFEGDLIVHVNGVAVPLTVTNAPGAPRRSAARGGKDGGSRSGPWTIVAPMPGRIVKVLVKPGQAVAARQPLVVVEAMKMENELRAPRGGSVAEVRVSEGSSVEANAVLVVLA
jgi:biotin carboxyl carrier protein